MIEIFSFGTLCKDRAEPLPNFTMMVDLGDQLHDPHIDSAFRELTGHDQRVVDRVLATPGAEAMISSIVGVIMRFSSAKGPIRVGIACRGGRHRSVVIADAVFNMLGNLGEDASVNHIDIRRPVVKRPKEVSA